MCLSLQPSPVPEGTPDERPLVRERHHSAPLLPLRSDTCAPLPSPTDKPADSYLVSALDPTSVLSDPQTPLIAALAPADRCELSHGLLPRVSASPTLALSASAPPMDSAGHIPDTTDSEYAAPSPFRTASPALLTALDLTALDQDDPDPFQDPDLDEHHTTSPASSPHPASSPLSSPPSSPSPGQRGIHAPLSPAPVPPALPRAAGTKRSSPEETDECDVETDAEADIAEPASTLAPARARSKRRRRDANADDKPWRDRKKQLSTPPHDTSSSSSSSSSSTPSSPPAASSPVSDAPEPCPHPALLGLLLETLALSRASSLTQSALVRTNPALAPSSSPDASAVLATTLGWAVRARVLGCVRSSGEALPPSYFYDPTEDPDRERAELLRCLMPRAGKRRETMKYKQYYWAPVVVGRGRTRTWDVDWEE